MPAAASATCVVRDEGEGVARHPRRPLRTPAPAAHDNGCITAEHGPSTSRASTSRAHVQVEGFVQLHCSVEEGGAGAGDGARTGAVLLPLVIPEAAVCERCRGGGRCGSKQEAVRSAAQQGGRISWESVALPAVPNTAA